MIACASTHVNQRTSDTSDGCGSSCPPIGCAKKKITSFRVSSFGEYVFTTLKPSSKETSTPVSSKISR